MSHNTCIIIPTYNNAGTILRVIEDVKPHGLPIIVVNDGCTDSTAALLADVENISVVDYGRNRGKGYALKAGFRYALNQGYDYAITLDADGQHYAADIPTLLQAHASHPNALIVGSRTLRGENIPDKNIFANKFSNFWFMVQTWQQLSDTQTGYRLYPLNNVGGLKVLTSRYEAELEMLVFSAWKGTQLLPVKVGVYYPPAAERVTHFRPVYDFFRISVLNTILCILAVIYGYPMLLFHRLFK